MHSCRLLLHALLQAVQQLTVLASLQLAQQQTITCKPPRPGVLSTAGGALAGRSICRLRCSTVMVKMAWLRLDLCTSSNKCG